MNNELRSIKIERFIQNEPNFRYAKKRPNGCKVGKNKQLQLRTMNYQLRTIIQNEPNQTQFQTKNGASRLKFDY